MRDLIFYTESKDERRRRMDFFSQNLAAKGLEIFQPKHFVKVKPFDQPSPTGPWIEQKTPRTRRNTKKHHI